MSQPRYYAKTWYDRQTGPTYEKDPRYNKLFSMTMHKYGYDFAVWYIGKVIERQKMAFYDVEQAWKDFGRRY